MQIKEFKEKIKALKLYENINYSSYSEILKEVLRLNSLEEKIRKGKTGRLNSKLIFFPCLHLAMEKLIISGVNKIIRLLETELK